VPVVRATHCHGRAEPDGEPKAHASTMPERRRVAPRVIRARNRSLRDVAAGLLAASVARRTACRVRPEAEPHPVSHAARRTVAPRRAAGPSRERRGSPLAASPRGMSGRVADIRWRSPLATGSGVSSGGLGLMGPSPGGVVAPRAGCFADSDSLGPLCF